MEKNLEKIIFSALILLTIIIFIIGLKLINLGISISEYPEFERYDWDIYSLEGENTCNFSMFNINYRFDEKEGTLSFKPKCNLTQMIINFPEDLIENVTSDIMYKSNVWSEFPINLIPSKQKSAKANILFNITNNSGEWIRIHFKINLSPNARFKINKNSYWSGGQVYFNLGNEFQCLRDDCAFNLAHFDFARRDTSPLKSFRLDFANQSLERPIHRFELSARSLKITGSKNFYVSFGASLIAGSIFALFSIIIGIIQSPNLFRKRSKSKKRKK